MDGQSPQRALVSACRSKLAILDTDDAKRTSFRPLPRTPTARLDGSFDDRTFEGHDIKRQALSRTETVLYLAYGSNLSNETFLGKRGIKPLSQVNVQVPSLRLTFDLPGIPYNEPCFANTALRNPEKDRPNPYSSDDEKARFMLGDSLSQEYRKDAWHKGLIGVVYEVTPDDYAHIIATEGGGASYQDILVDCHPFATDDPKAAIPRYPTTATFKAHTLFAPAVPPEGHPPKDGGSFQRPDPSYAQPSARYLKLIADGAEERGLPYEYRDYLQSLRPYRITTRRQRLGQAAYGALWLPIVFAVFGLGKMLADENGRLPAWLRKLTATVFVAAWISYDNAFKPLFGDGERTVGDIEDDGEKEVNGRESWPESFGMVEKSPW